MAKWSSGSALGASVETAEITDSAVSTAKIADDAVTAAKLASGSVLVPIETNTLGSAGTTISFTGIATGFKGFLIVGHLRTDRSGQATNDCVIELSTSSTFDTTASNYNVTGHNVRSTTIDANPADNNNISINGAFLGATSTANAMCSFFMYLSNTTETQMKTGVYQVGSEAQSKMVESGWFEWTNTNEIDGIRLVAGNSANWIAGSSVTIYGVV